jgi:hypothetical protein
MAQRAALTGTNVHDTAQSVYSTVWLFLTNQSSPYTPVPFADAQRHLEMRPPQSICFIYLLGLRHIGYIIRSPVLIIHRRMVMPMMPRPMNIAQTMQVGARTESKSRGAARLLGLTTEYSDGCSALYVEVRAEAETSLRARSSVAMLSPFYSIGNLHD